MDFNTGFDPSVFANMGSLGGPNQFNLNGIGSTTFDTSSLNNFSGLSPTASMPASMSNLGLNTAPTSLSQRMSNLGDGIANNQGALTFGLSALQGLAGAWSAWNSNKNQKDLINFNKRQYETNLAMNKQALNNSIYDRQVRRVSANPNAESVDTYMNKWGAK